MKPTLFSNTHKTACTRRQRGDALIEAMIGVLVTAILFVGVNTSLAKTLTSQRYSNAQHLALLQMRDEIQTGGITDICSGGADDAAVAGWTVTQTATCNNAALTVAINAGLSVSLAAGAVPAITFSLSTDSNTTSQDLFGGNGVLTMSD